MTATDAVDLAATADLWWKNAVFYCLDVQTFADSDGDGIGDFAGLTSKVDYLAGLGVTCIWLMPFFPTADKDDGYDITEHYAIDPRLGSFGDFTEFVRTARDRGHARHRRSRRQPHVRPAPLVPGLAALAGVAGSASSTSGATRCPTDGPSGVVFPGRQEGVWSYDAEAGQYYLHRFYRHQPDLDVASARRARGDPQDARVLAGPGPVRLPRRRRPVPPRDGRVRWTRWSSIPHEYLRDLRAFLSRRVGEAVLLGEVNLPTDEQRRFFGDEDGDELHMLFDFLGMQATWLSLARGDAGPLIGPSPSPTDPPRGRVGLVPAQPRRADARQADAGTARRGVRRLRPGSRHAALREGPAAPGAVDARR